MIAKLGDNLTANFATVEDVLIFAASTSLDYFTQVWWQIFHESVTQEDFEGYRNKVDRLPDVLNRTLCSNGKTLKTNLLRKMNNQP